MTYEDFEKLHHTMVQEEFAVGRAKGIEYGLGDDRLSNFKRQAAYIGLTPLQVWYVYFMKHIDAITFFIKSGGVKSESIESRIMDARVYLALLRALVDESVEEKRQIEEITKEYSEMKGKWDEPGD